VSHRTYRHVDTPVPYLGLSWRQWALIVSCAALAFGLIHLLSPPTPVALWIGTVLLTAPVTVTYFTNGASVSVGRLLRDHLLWLWQARELPAAIDAEEVEARGFVVSSDAGSARRPGKRHPRSAPGRPTSSDLCPLEALSAEGVGVLGSGALIRWIEVSPVNPLNYEPEAAENISRSFTSMIGRLPDERQSIQLTAQALPLPVDSILTAEKESCEWAAEAARARGWDALAVAVERLGMAEEQSVRTQSAALHSLQIRYFLSIPWVPTVERFTVRGRRSNRRLLTLSPERYERADRELSRHAEGVRTDLESMGLTAGHLDGAQVADLLASRLSPTVDGSAKAFICPQLPLTLGDLTDAIGARVHARELKLALCAAPVSFQRRTVTTIGAQVEQTRYVGSLPEQTWLGWLLYLMSAHRPFTVTVHCHGTDSTRERLFHKRRYRRIYGNNRGTEMKGRPLDPDQQAQESEAADLIAELALTGAGVYRLGCYFSVREVAGDLDTVTDIVDGIGRELSAANEAHLHPGVAAQRPLFISSLPVGLDAARRTRKFVSVNVGDTVPFVGTSCGSPAGIPLGYSAVGRTLERLDLFDPAHSNHLLVVTGESGFGKTMLVNSIYCRALGRGDQGAVIERGGHYQFLASLVPGSANVTLGNGADAICPWDTPDPRSVGAEKIDYLLALHATLIGTGRPQEYGLSALEQNLLGRAVRQVYERCAVTGERPRELILQETLTARAVTESQAGANQLADALRDLAARLHNFCGEGPYSYLTDRETTVPADAPLLVFDTRRIPQNFAGAAMFLIVEHVAERVARNVQRHFLLDGNDGSRRAPRYYFTLEEVWKLLDHEATARWVNELPRRSRHENLGLIGVSQQLSDFDTPRGRAFIDNAARKVSFHQSPRQLQFLKEELGLTAGEVEEVAQQRTVKREYSTAYFDNGPRGRGTITQRYADLEYWICTHEPEFDEPIRLAALRDAHDDPWRALRLLADKNWHAELGARAA
jgi:hypothetical protein